jgi:phosphocarrier protein FPr/phosphocarrier protein
MSDLVLVSPLKGWVGPLNEAPDAVFAEKMMGDGVAVDPTLGALHAPCDGEVMSVHHTRHAVALRALNGAELLIHIGLETVGLAGEGFETHVAAGDRVKAGDLLIRFDLDFLARHARSLLTPVIITNSDVFVIADRAADGEIDLGAPLMTLRGAVSGQAEPQAPAAGELIRTLVLPLAHGLHARPAARLASLAQSFENNIAIIAGDRRVNAKSPVSILTLGARCGDTIRLVAEGASAAEALDALVSLIEGGMGELASVSAPVALAIAEPQPTAPQAVAAGGVLRGVKAAPGMAIGVAARLTAPPVIVNEHGRGPAVEGPALDAALTEVKARLKAQFQKGQHHHRAILSAHLAFLDDPDLVEAARRRIGGGASAGAAWRGAIDGYAEVLRGLGDPRMAERVDDLLDLERQVLLVLSGEADRTIVLPQGAILLADDLLPSQLIGLDAALLSGICTARGGPTSHVAILAAAMNLPALVAVGPGVSAIAEGATLILDADASLLRVDPDPATLKTAHEALALRRTRREAALAVAQDTCRMADETRIEVFANLGSVVDAHTAIQNGAEGCGLLRTEFLFMDRADAPNEDEQTASYRAIAEALGGRPLILRTLDVGGDKPLDYLPIPPEENPALGLRGVRVGFWRPEMLRTQIRAILRASPTDQCRIMVPMVASVDELLAVRAIVDEVRREMHRTEPVALGVMIETPAAAITADLLAVHADFLSVGTNDLAQYTLAMDRGNPLLAAQVDGLHPAVLRLIARAAEGAQTHNRMLGVCGGLASDPHAVPILIGLGVTELSVTPSMVAETKALIRILTVADCRVLAARALVQTCAADVRRLVDEGLTSLKLDRGAA